jgi:protein SCO1/2
VEEEGVMTLNTNSRLLATLLCVLLTGCNRAPDPSTTSTPRNQLSYSVRGVIQRIEPGGRQTLIAHEEIRGYMAAMTMEFTAAEASELAGLQPGDEITFQLNVGEKESLISAVHKTGRKGPVAPTAHTVASTPAPGAQLPDTELIDEAGDHFRLSDLRGKALAFTFIFTRCPLPDFCPRLSMHFADVRKDLAASGPAAKWRLLSISIDPAYDTPERLRDYAEQYGADRTGWIFATGEPDAIRRLASASGLIVSGEAPSLNHNLRTIVLDTEGKVARVFPGNEWKPAEVVAEVERQLARKP